MDSETKHIHHGTTVVIDGGVPQNPPPYSAPGVNPGYPPSHLPPTHVHVEAVVPAAIIVSPALGPHRTAMTCRSCNAQIMTEVRYVSSTRTHLLAALLCLLGCWPCVCVPYCVDTCQNATHYCPNCGAYIGSYQS